MTIKYWIHKLYLKLKYLKFKNLHTKYKGYTMIPTNSYYSNLELCIAHQHINGAIVECGTWKGGMMASIAEVMGPERAYYLFDSYEGLPDATEKDGADASLWQKESNSEWNYNNCTADQQSAINAMQLSRAKNVTITKGWFNETLPQQRFENGIAILRMDADWYDSTMDILNNLYPFVNKGGVVIIDDYYYWEGCAKAVHDYFSINNCLERLQMTSRGVCYFIKK